MSLFGGCTDIMDKLLFFKSEIKKEAPKKHKLDDPNDPKVIKRDTGPKDKVTPPDKGVAGEGEEGVPTKPEGDKTTQPGEGGVAKGPGTEKGAPGDETTVGKKNKDIPMKPPGGDAEKPDGTEATDVGKGEKPADKEATKGKDKKPDTETAEAPKKLKKEEPPVKDKGGSGKGNVIGEDIALLPVSPGSEAPTGDLTAKKGGFTIDKEFKYDPTKKRDPFRPYNVKIQKKTTKPVGELTPLQKFKLSQLTVKAIIYDPETDTGVAMIEDPAKRGYNIYVGTEIANGKVIAITPSEIRVRVEYTDFFDNPKTTIETLKVK